MYLKVLSKIFVFKFGDVIIPFLDGNVNAFEDQYNYSNYLGGKGGGIFKTEKTNGQTRLMLFSRIPSNT